MKPNVLSEIVDRDLCIGCGVCAAICPDDVLAMQFNRFGEYNPVDVKGCTKECGLCLKVCPFADGNADEDAIGGLLFGEIPRIEHRSETGYFLEGFVGHSQIDGHRERGSSGGMATWLLQSLIENGEVDAVVCVKSNSDAEKLFEFAVFTTGEEVRRASGSAYYPVELSGVLRYIMEHPGRYAVIGLPCFVKAIRLAQMRNRNLRERIVVVLGLTCGQLKSKHYTAYLSALAGLEEAPTRVHYRGKDLGQPATNYHFSCTGSGGEERRVYWKGGVSEAWSNRWFTPGACNYCDDIFAECADVTFMDAWLHEWIRDSRGTSLIINRSRKASDIFHRSIREGIANIKTIGVEQIIRSQAGVVSLKREQLAYRLFQSNKLGIRTPKKRITMQSIRNPLLRREIILKNKMQQKSRIFFNKSGDFVPNDFQVPPEIMRTDLYQIRLLHLINALIGLPWRRLRKMLRDT